jgi:hypothetical protein
MNPFLRLYHAVQRWRPTSAIVGCWIGLLLSGCEAATPTMATEDFQAYVTIANQFIAQTYPDEYNSYLRHKIDSLGEQSFEQGNSCWQQVEGAHCLGGFSMYGMPTACELFAVDVIGDSAREHMLLIDHSTLGTYQNYSFLFFHAQGAAKSPFAQYEFSAEDITKIHFARLLQPDQYDLVIDYVHSPSVYLNEGVAIVHIDADTAREIGNIMTMHYDWKDFGKHAWTDLNLTLADEEAYRESAELKFVDQDGDGVTEIIAYNRREIVLQDWDVPIAELQTKALIGKDTAAWIYFPKRHRYESRGADPD